MIVSINRGIPFLLVDKSRPLSRSILSLAEVVKKRISEFEFETETVTSVKNNGKK